MERDALFLATLDDMEARLRPGLKEYDVLLIAGLLRKLLLDGQPLTDQVNRERRLRIRFRANCGGPSAVVLEDRPAIWSIQDGFDPDTQGARRVQPAELSRDAMLKCVVMLIAGESITVHELIDVGAHVEGAVHAGAPSTPTEKAVATLNEDFQIGGMAASTRSLLAIARVTLRGLEPLRQAIRKA